MADMKSEEPITRVTAIKEDTVEVGNGEVINASGHKQELERNFGLLSIASVGIVTGSEWPALGGSIVVAIFNGGPPGVIYEFVVVTFFYLFVAASIAELASAIPSSAGVYHWASVTAGPRYGKVVGYFAGWWNCLAWTLGAASMSAIVGQIVLSMWALYHPAYLFQRWHLFVVYLIATWTCCFTVCFANRALPKISTLGLLFILGGVVVTILICAIMPHTTGSGYASNHFVWSDWVNETGWPDGLAFLTGMLNGAYAVGTPDVTSHLCEEIPNPRRNVPLAVLAQMSIGFVTAFAYLVAIFYSITDLNAVLTSTVSFPIAAVYAQATNSRAGAFGLLLVIFFPIWCTLIGAYLTAGRILWTLARDDATPFCAFLKRVHPTMKNPLNATLTTGLACTVLGCIYVGSATAFNAFVGSFVVLSSISYVSAILPNLLTRRRYVVPGPFYMRGIWGFIVNAISSVYIIVFIVIYCFPFGMPFSALTMNYACLITGGLTIFIAAWYLVTRSRGYEGPKLIMEEVRRQAAGVSGGDIRAELEAKA